MITWLRDHWKPLLAGALTLGVLAVAAVRFKNSFAPRAPAVLQYTRHTSPGFTFNADLRQSWKNVEAFVAQCRREERATLKRLAQLSFTHVCRWPAETMHWDSFEARNAGFEPVRRVERSEPGARQQLIGYYTLDGQPLAYDTKTDPRNPRQTLTTVTLAEPLPPGKTELIWRVTRSTARVATNAPGKATLTLGRLPVSPAALSAVGLAFPAPAQLERYPAAGAFVQSRDEQTVVTWLSTQLDAPVPTVTVRVALNPKANPTK